MKRVLRDDGVLFLNLGDSYISSGGNTKGYGPNADCGNTIADAVPQENYGPRQSQEGMKPKDLCGIPWMAAFALRADGWYLRSEITWCKKAPMPESVTDRPTSATEKIFLLAKSEHYFYDSEAIKEPTVTCDNIVRDRDATKLNNTPGRTEMMGLKENNYSTRNIRNYWLLSPEPSREAHFATFPTAIPRRAIRAGTSAKGCCPECGSPWERVVEKKSDWDERKAAGEPARHGLDGAAACGASDFKSESKTIGWKPACDCNAGEPVPCTVCDPFGGSGTTAMVALKEGRRAIVIELNPGYVELIKKRCADIQSSLMLE